MTPEELAEIQGRHEAATPGPWWSDESDLMWRLHGVHARIPGNENTLLPEQIINKQIVKAPKSGTNYAEYWPDEADDAFITHAWQDIADLLAEAKRLIDERDRYKAATANWSTESVKQQERAEQVEDLAKRLIALVDEALAIRMYGERAPGGTENWADWDIKAEAEMRGIRGFLGDNEAETTVQILQERNQLREEVARLHQGENTEPLEEGTWPLVGQWIYRFNTVDAEARQEMAQRAIDNAIDVVMCHQNDHRGRISDLKDQNNGLAAQIHTVLKLHKHMTDDSDCPDADTTFGCQHEPGEHVIEWCNHCDNDTWPCETVALIVPEGAQNAEEAS